MTIQRVVKKSKLGLEDITMGEGIENQNRNGGLYPVTQFRYVYPVNTLVELDDLDPLVYTKARLYAGDGLTPPTDYEYINDAWEQTSIGGGGSIENLTEVQVVIENDKDIMQYNGETEKWEVTNIANALDLTAAYAWTGSHSFTQFITLEAGISGWNTLKSASFSLLQNVDGAPVLGSITKTATIKTVDKVNFNIAGTVYEAYHQNNIHKAVTPINVKTESYAFGVGDAGYLITMDNVAANSVTVPVDTTADLPIGTTVSVCQIGAGVTTIVAEAGAVLMSEVGLVIKGQYGFATLLKIAVDTWLVTGSLSA